MRVNQRPSTGTLMITTNMIQRPALAATFRLNGVKQFVLDIDNICMCNAYPLKKETLP